MAVISFSENLSGAAWVVAGWAFRQVMADALMQHSADADLAAVFEQAEAVGYLRLGYLENPLSGKVASVLKDTAAAILAGRIQSGIDRFDDPQMSEEYLKGLRMLLDAAQLAETRGVSGGCPEPEEKGDASHRQKG
jgi:hypothetical protein